MRVASLSFNDVDVEFHPRLTVVRASDSASRIDLITAIKKALTGESDGVNGLIDIFGLLVDLDSKELGEIGLPVPVATVFGPEHLPGVEIVVNDLNEAQAIEGLRGAAADAWEDVVAAATRFAESRDQQSDPYEAAAEAVELPAQDALFEARYAIATRTFLQAYREFLEFANLDGSGVDPQQLIDDNALFEQALGELQDMLANSELPMAPAPEPVSEKPDPITSSEAAVSVLEDSGYADAVVGADDTDSFGEGDFEAETWGEVELIEVAPIALSVAELDPVTHAKTLLEGLGHLRAKLFDIDAELDAEGLPIVELEAEIATARDLITKLGPRTENPVIHPATDAQIEAFYDELTHLETKRRSKRNRIAQEEIRKELQVLLTEAGYQTYAAYALGRMLGPSQARNAEHTEAAHQRLAQLENALEAEFARRSRDPRVEALRLESDDLYQQAQVFLGDSVAEGDLEELLSRIAQGDTSVLAPQNLAGPAELSAGEAPVTYSDDDPGEAAEPALKLSEADPAEIAVVSDDENADEIPIVEPVTDPALLAYGHELLERVVLHHRQVITLRDAISFSGAEEEDLTELKATTGDELGDSNHSAKSPEERAYLSALTSYADFRNDLSLIISRVPQDQIGISIPNNPWLEISNFFDSTVTVVKQVSNLGTIPIVLSDAFDSVDSTQLSFVETLLDDLSDQLQVIYVGGSEVLQEWARSQPLDKVLFVDFESPRNELLSTHFE